MTAAGSRYAADVAYPDHFHRETMPTWLCATAAALGFAPPDITGPYRWCELGCGGGINVLAAAVCNPIGQFTGFDIDPAAIARAQDTAAQAGIGNVRFHTLDLRNAAGHDIAGFDFIVSHGVWSWVGDDVRQGIVDFVRDHLVPGGLVQMAYMSHPGASPLAAVAALMREHARHAQGDDGQRAVAALAAVRALADAGAGLFAEHPGLSRQIDAMQGKAPAYLAHEFLAGQWQPQHAADTIRAFATAGCGFIGSATPIENIDALSIPGAVQPLLQGISPGPLAETCRDIARNQSLRRDLYQRDAMPLAPEQHLRALDALHYGALPGAPDGGELRFETRIGPVPGPAELFDPVLGALARGPQAFRTLRALPPYDRAPGLLNQVLQTLQWAGFAHPLREDASAAPATEALDQWLRQCPSLQGRRGWHALPAFGTASAGAPA